MQLWTEIRRRVLAEGLSRRQACREYGLHWHTLTKILEHLLGVPPRGVSLTELFDEFERRAQDSAVVLLDELELMSPKDRDREILYLLSRSQKRFMVISLSNNPRVLRELDLATRSSLQPVPVHFRNYDADQIRRILLDRAQQGLRRYDEAVLAKIAALTVRRTNSDARVAIKTLYYCVTQADRSLEELSIPKTLSAAHVPADAWPGAPE